MFKFKEFLIIFVLIFLFTGCDSNIKKERFNNSDFQTKHIEKDQEIDTSIQPNSKETEKLNNEEKSNDEENNSLKRANIAEEKPKNWYIRLIAEDTVRKFKTTDAQLGQLDKDEAAQKHTLKALKPFGIGYLDIIFRDPANVEAGEYKANFHRFIEDSEDSWQFTVRTDDSHANISLTWRGLYVLTPYTDTQDRQRYKEYRSMINPLIQNMRLIDSSNGKEMPVMSGIISKTYFFNMNGQTERIFEWVVKRDDDLTSDENK